MNTIALMGRLARDPAIRQIQGQKGMVKAANFPLVVRRNRTNKSFVVMVSAYGANAEFAEKYLEKGTKIMLYGELNSTPYKDKETGRIFYYTEVIMESVEFGEAKRKENSDHSEDGFRRGPAKDNPFEIPPKFEAEMPFR